MERADEVARELASERLRPELLAWRAAHPQATMWEIEDVVDGHLAEVRAQLVKEMAEESGLTNLGRLPEEERPRCEACGSRVQARGQRERILRGSGNERATLRRSYAVCPHCGLGVFPPR